MRDIQAGQFDVREDSRGSSFRALGAGDAESSTGLALPVSERVRATRGPAYSPPKKESSASIAPPMRVLAWPIDPANPYTVSLYSNMGPGVRVDEFSATRLIHAYRVWHIHWPESLLNIRNPAMAAFKMAGFLTAIDLVRMRGGKVIWTVHNLQAHDALHPVLEAWFWRRFIPRVDGVISLSETALALAQEKFARLRSLPAVVIPHGHYRENYRLYTGDARADLGIPGDARVVLFFGEVRRYKNVEALVRAFRGVGDRNVVLLIAGRPKDPALAENLRKEAPRDTRVRLNLQFIAREQVARYFAAADLVVLPYRQILNSGAALLALSFSRPVLVPDLGSMANLRDDFGTGWVRTFAGEIDTPTLEDALGWAAQPRPSVCPMPENYRWESIRTQTLRFYAEVLRGA